MPKPIVCLSDQLRQFLAAFRTCFTKRQWRYFVIVLLALIECEERRTMTGLLRTIGEYAGAAPQRKALIRLSESEEIFVYSPKGDIYYLPKGSLALADKDHQPDHLVAYLDGNDRHRPAQRSLECGLAALAYLGVLPGS